MRKWKDGFILMNWLRKQGKSEAYGAVIPATDFLINADNYNDRIPAEEMDMETCLLTA